MPHLHNTTTLYSRLGQVFLLDIQGKASEFHPCALAGMQLKLSSLRYNSVWPARKQMGSGSGAVLLLDLGKVRAIARERLNVYYKGSVRYLYNRRSCQI